MVVPFAPSAAWYVAYISSMLSGADETQAIALANRGLVSGKDFARCDIAGASARQTLSLPVEGGSSRLKRKDFARFAVLSEHGRWRETHAGALSAAYGRTPFFTHLFPDFEKIYSDREITTLAAFNLAVFNVTTRTLGIPSIIETLREDHTDALREAIMEIKAEIDPSLSIFDALFRLGKTSLLGLTP